MGGIKSRNCYRSPCMPCSFFIVEKCGISTSTESDSQRECNQNDSFKDSFKEDANKVLNSNSGDTS